MKKCYLEPTQQSGAELFSRDIVGEVLMLNLIRVKDKADYSNYPQLAPENEISGKQAFQKYIEHTLPFLEQSGGELCMLGSGGSYFIGPTDEKWDIVMLVKQSSLERFMQFASNVDYQAGIGHRTAALLDSRLLPIVEAENNNIASLIK